MIADSAMITSRGPASHAAAEPEHEHHAQRNCGVVRDLCTGNWPDGAAEPAAAHRTARGNHEPEEHRAEQHQHGFQVAADEQHVATPEIGGKQPQRGHELLEPERPIRGTSEVLGIKQVKMASMASRLTRQRKMLGRITSLRFAVSATSSATGRAP